MINKPYVKYIILGILLLLFIIVVADVYEGCVKKRTEKNIQQQEQIKNTPVTHYRDKDSIDHAEKPVAEVDLYAADMLYNHIIDSLRSVIKTKEGDIKAILQAGTETQQYFKPDIDYINIDTSVSQIADSVRYQDKWLTLKGSIQTKEFEYTVRDSLTFVAYNKRTGLFTKQLFLNAFSQNPHTQINGLTAIKIDVPKPKKFGFGVFAGYTWDGNALKPTAGIGINYNIIRF